MLYDRPRTDQEYVPAGVVQGFGNKAKAENWLEIEVKSPLRQGETLEYLSRDISVVSIEVTELQDLDGIPLEQANPGNIVRVKYGSGVTAAWEVNGLLRKKR
jgi:hypothetical protein